MRADAAGGRLASRGPPPMVPSDEHFATIHVVARHAPYLLIARHGRFAVIERRNGRLYNLHCGRRAPGEMTDAGALDIVGKDWCDEATARRLFDQLATRYDDLAERMW